jgi:hypothetical protein
MNRHLTADELIDRVYGLGEQDQHVDQCAECSGRLRQLREMRAASAEMTTVPYSLLAAQRRNIYARMGEKPRSGMKWVPALAAVACMIAAGVVSHRPEATHYSGSAKPEMDEAQLFSDVYSMEQSMEPVAAKPIHAIFEQEQQ